jgi:hypothetical protein
MKEPNMETLFDLPPVPDPDRDNQAHARRTDPPTSHAAARSIASEKIRASQKAILMLLEARGPLTDEEIATRYAQTSRMLPDHFPPQSPSGLRTRRSELHQAGYVIDTGEQRKLKSGRWAIVWGLA